jgi:hypothetical protein
MDARRLPIVFMIGGFVCKGLLVGLWRLFKIPEVLNLLTTYDPVAFAFAQRGAALFFDTRRIAPTSGESALFEVLLVIAFSVECLLLGFIIPMVPTTLPGSS